MVVNATQISQSMKKKNWLRIEKKYYRMRKKCVNVFIRKYFNLENFASL